jgi:tetratricopeptide (TPR) repeat protein
VVTLTLVDQLTQQALAALDRGDYTETQRLFRQNAKEHPCLSTFNNLGFFYKEYGLQLQGGKVRDATALGLKYLLKAADLGLDYKNRMALGYCSLLENDYTAAVRYYTEVLAVNPRHEVLYNLGIARYRQQQYSEALSLFQQADAGPMPGDAEGDYRRCVQQGMLFCHYYSGEIETAMALLSAPDATEVRDEMGLEAFVLAYRCGRMEYAKALYLTYGKAWSPRRPVLAMMVECYMKLDMVKETENPIDAYFENNDWMSTKEVRAFKQELLDPIERAKLIETHRFRLPILHLCYYIGCSEHPDGGYGKTSGL